MGKLIAVVLAVFGSVMLLPLLGVLFGAFVGWAVGLFFTDTIIGFLSRVGVDTAGLAVWEVGAALGFLGAFFKSSSHVSASK